MHPQRPPVPLLLDGAPEGFGGFFEESLHASRLIVRFSGRTWHPPMDVYETAGALVVRMEIAGVRPGDLQVLIQDDVLTISGRRPAEQTRERRVFAQMEIAYGCFERSVPIPFAVRHDAARAAYRDGILEILLPKGRRNSASSGRIEISF